MGIKGLLPFLKDVQTLSNIRNFKGSTVAVDTYGWLHRGAYGWVEQIAYGRDDGQYVAYCMRYVRLLISWGLKPILVFDGRNLPAKELTEKERRERRQLNRTKALAVMREGKQAEARRFLERCIDITPAMAARVIQAARAEGVDCIVAPYEADAQLAYLSRCGIAQVIISEDSDLLLFGCERVFFKLDMNGNGILIEQNSLPKLKAFRNNFTLDKFLAMCILSGCDYLPSLPGIGIAKACKFVFAARHDDIAKALKRMPMYLNMPSLEVTDQYVADFESAWHTFRHQLVFDPISRRLIPLTDYPPGLDPATLACAGEYMSDEQALQLALGNINCKDGRRLADHKADSIEEHKKHPQQQQRRHSTSHSHASRKQHDQPSIWDPLFKKKKESQEKPPPIPPSDVAASEALINYLPHEARKSPAKRLGEQPQCDADRRRSHDGTAAGRCTRMRLALPRETASTNKLSSSRFGYGSGELVKELLSAYAFSNAKPGVVETPSRTVHRGDGAVDRDCGAVRHDDKDAVDEGLCCTIGSGASSSSSSSSNVTLTQLNGSATSDELGSFTSGIDESLTRSPDRKPLQAVQPLAVQATAAAAGYYGSGLDLAGGRGPSQQHSLPLQSPSLCELPLNVHAADTTRSPVRTLGDSSPSAAETSSPNRPLRRSNVFAATYRKEPRFCLDASPPPLTDGVATVSDFSTPSKAIGKQAAAGAVASVCGTADAIVKSRYFSRGASSSCSNRTSVPLPATGDCSRRVAEATCNGEVEQACSSSARRGVARGSSPLDAFQKVDPASGSFLRRAGRTSVDASPIDASHSNNCDSPGDLLPQQVCKPSASATQVTPAAAAVVDRKPSEERPTPAMQFPANCDQRLSTSCFHWQSSQRVGRNGRVATPNAGAAKRLSTVGTSLASPFRAGQSNSKQSSAAGLGRSGTGSLLAYLRPTGANKEARDVEGTLRSTAIGPSAKLSSFDLLRPKHRAVSKTVHTSDESTTAPPQPRHSTACDVSAVTMPAGGRKRHASSSDDEDCMIVAPSSRADATLLRHERVNSPDDPDGCDTANCREGDGDRSPAKRATLASAFDLRVPSLVDCSASGGANSSSTPQPCISLQLVKFKYQSRSCPARTRVSHQVAR